MLKIKKLYGFMLQGFLPLFMMTFCICLFIVLMQFLWRFIDDLVGKGLEISVIAELFFYAALTMVPLALPLSILLASLMLFGNLGERFELTAMKSSGVSLLKAMPAVDGADSPCGCRRVLFSERCVAKGAGEDVDAGVFRASEIA